MDKYETNGVFNKTKGKFIMKFFYGEKKKRSWILAFAFIGVCFLILSIIGIIDNQSIEIILLGFCASIAFFLATLTVYLRWNYWVINENGIEVRRKIGIITSVKWEDISRIEERYLGVELVGFRCPTGILVIGYSIFNKKKKEKFQKNFLELNCVYNGVVHLIKNETILNLIKKYYHGDIIDAKEESIKKYKINMEEYKVDVIE